MAMGIPLIHGVLGESKEIIEKNNAGICFNPEDEKSLFNAILKMRNNKKIYLMYKKNCINLALNFDRSNLAKKMFNIINKFLKK